MIEMIRSSKEEKGKEVLPFRELPKNVRQIGNTKEKRKIYIEDFVVTYLKWLSKPEHAYARGAILLGNIYRTAEGTAVFISGALEAQNLELDIEETIFDEAVWRQLLAQRDQHFPGQAVVGWFLSRIGFSVELNPNILKAHLKHFPGNYKVLYLMDALENEDAFYLCENQQMIRQRGYYIYYEKNSRMREYMMKEKGEEVRREEKEEGREQIRRDKKIVRNYRRIDRYGKQKKKQKEDAKIRLTRAASAVVVVGTLAYAMYQMRGDWMTEEMRNSVAETVAGIQSAAESKVENSSVATSSEKDQIWEEEEGTSKTEEESKDLTTETITTETTPIEITTPGDTTPEETQVSQSTEEDLAASAVQGKPLYYIVQQGDTLAAISRKMYTTDQYASRIAQANELENENEIYIGQKILIPSIE